MSKAIAHSRERLAAGKQPTQLPGGAFIADVKRLRDLTCANDINQQMVFVYDDPAGTNSEHAVIRLSSSVPEEERAGIADGIWQAFQQRKIDPR